MSNERDRSSYRQRRLLTIEALTPFLLLTGILVLVGWSVGAAEGVVGKHDRYFGTLAHTTTATGFFRVEKIRDRWWLITPEGHPFYSAGVNGIRFSGTATAAGVKHYEQTAGRVYGSREAWAEAQIARCARWGFNTAGAWSDWQLLRKRMPYTVILYVGGSDWRTGRIADYFDESFRAAAREKIQKVAAPLADDPYLVGYFLDNEMRWGADHRGGHLLDDCIARDPASAGKKSVVAFLKKRYETIARLQMDFATGAASWEALLQYRRLPARGTSGAAATRAVWAGEAARVFFTTLDEELRAADPNHLNLGVRFIGQMTPKEVIAEAGKVVDVMSVNFYELTSVVTAANRLLHPFYLPTDDFLAAHYEAGGRPILVSEWGYRAADSGLPNTWPPIYPTLATQRDRADAYERTVRRALAHPWIVGQHWFIYTDQPPEGRFDGENNNWGLLSEKDAPYAELVERAAGVHREIYLPFESVEGETE